MALAAAVDDDGAHADGMHEDDVGEDFAELVVVVHEGAAELDDDEFFIEPLDVAEGLDEGVGFFKYSGFHGDVHAGNSCGGKGLPKGETDDDKSAWRQMQGCGAGERRGRSGARGPPLQLCHFAR